ncbi:hypothetical protein CUC15_04385 [Oceanobacillus zhaokaii]|uniref:DUF4179 domain-containing protein n=1 Tax=Oceanobacillus zhaokaii TaxID=2052660 RepID=A0A345PE16_9BACI|nr:DUF4179 domain-containing protein [Oceanobacillus zhaokaii]AXI08246.1 hypothetical protein CUC15_04385 [Oceanobacillus zhaokaii]
MKNSFEKEFNQIMSEEKEMPVKVRKSLDQSYDIIRAKSKKKKVNFIWKRVATAACALIVTGVVLTNEHVMASINEFFNFGDKGIEQAINNGFIQESDSTITDQGIKITLDKHFSDANKLGLNFHLAFEDPSILNNVREVSMDYRLKNGDGDYIYEFIPDTKPLKGDNRYTSGSEHQNPILDIKTGEIQYDVLTDSNEGVIPSLRDAVIEVESVNVFYNTGEIKKIDGNWKLSVANKDNEKPDLTVQYAMKDQTSIIQVTKANANPTSLNLTFSLDGIYENENTFVDMKIVDEDGNEYGVTGFRKSTRNNKTIISTNFPITSYSEANKLKLIVEGIGEVELLKK